MLEVTYTKQFRKGYKISKKRGKDIRKLDKVVLTLRKSELLAEKYKDHSLKGNYIGQRECHIEPDWLLVYRIIEDILVLERLGTHSDLF